MNFDFKFFLLRVECKHAWYLAATLLSYWVAVGYFNNWFPYTKWFKVLTNDIWKNFYCATLTSSPSHHFPISFHSRLSKSCVLWAPPWFGNSSCRRYSASVRSYTSGIWEQGQVLSCCLSHFTAHDLGSNYLAGWLPWQDIAFMFIQYFEHEWSYKHWIMVGKCEC